MRVRHRRRRRAGRSLAALAAFLLGAAPGHAGAAQRERAPAPPEGPAPAAWLESLAATLDSLVPAAMARHHTPGVSLALVSADGRVLLRAWGVADVESGARIDPNLTVFRVASVSKLFVATAVLQQAERGALDLHRDVNHYLAGPGIRQPSGPITLHHLLTHTAGLDDRNIGMFAASAEDVRPLGEYLRDRLPPQRAAPGQWTSYSNHGFALAAHVVETVAGEPFAAVVQRTILDPLGMSSSSFAQPVPPALEARLAKGHACDESGCRPMAADYRHAYPAGGLVTTAADMARFILAHLGGADAAGQNILADSTRALMHAQQFTHDARVPGMAYGFFRQRVRGDIVLTHAGSSSGFHALVALLPGRGAGLFVVVNGGSSLFGGEVFRAFAEGLVPPADAPEWRAAPAPLEELEELAGTYLLTRAPRLSIEAFPGLFAFQERVWTDSAGHLVRNEGGRERRYARVDSLLYREVGGDDYLAFRRDARGRIEMMFAGNAFFGSEFPGAYERLPWWGTPAFVNEVVSWALLPVLLLCVVWPLTCAVGAAVRRVRGRRAVRQQPGRFEVLGVASALAWCTLAALFTFGVLARMNRQFAAGGGDLLYGLPTGFARLLWLSPAIAVLSAALVMIAARAWARRRWTVLGRIYMSITAAAALLFTLVLVRFNLLPAAF